MGSTFGALEFFVEPRAGMYPGPVRRRDNPLVYDCDAVVKSLAILDALYLAVAEVTYLRGLGMSQWTAYFDHGGTDQELTIPAAGQGAAAKENRVYTNAVLESVESDGSTTVPGQYRVHLRFGLPELTG